MRFPIILFSAFLAAILFDGRLAVSQTARPSATVPTALQKAMEECKSRYGGVQRGWFWQQRYMYIEACFKEKTGVYPAQANLKFHANVNCNWRTWQTGRAFFC
jgi:hypothetical protein